MEMISEGNFRYLVEIFDVLVHLLSTPKTVVVIVVLFI